MMPYVPMPCPACGHVAPTLDEWARHFSECEPGEYEQALDLILECVSCGAAFATLRDAEGHEGCEDA